MAAFEISCPYWIYAPDGVNYISFNQPAEPQFAGYLFDVTGLDDSDIREAADLIASGHGGRSHKYFAGRRPWTLSGVIMPTTPASARTATFDRILGLMNLCLDADGQIQWQPSDGILRYANFRKQLSIRNTKGQGQVDRRFLIAGVIDSHVIMSGSGYDIQVAGPAPTINATNIGTTVAPVHFQIGAPFNNPIITNTVTGEVFKINQSWAAGSGTLDIDMTAKYPIASKVGVVGSNYNGSVDLTVSDWDIGVSPQRYNGTNVFTLTDAGGTNRLTASSFLRMIWHDSWV